ncbi:hypothetical protein BAE44_0009603, partial [Dichanthelium oligosanthes]
LQLFHHAWWQLSGSPTPMVLGWGQSAENHINVAATACHLHAAVAELLFSVNNLNV